LSAVPTPIRQTFCSLSGPTWTRSGTTPTRAAAWRRTRSEPNE